MNQDDVKQLVSVIDSALQAVWNDGIDRKKETEITKFLKEYFVLHREELPIADEIQIDIENGRCFEMNSNGTHDKEIETTTSFDSDTKGVRPDIIFHRPETHEDNILLVEVKKHENASVSGRMKDVETLQGMVSGKFKYKLAVSAEIAAESALLVWYMQILGENIFKGLRSVFNKGKSPDNLIMIKDCSRGQYVYHMYGDACEDAEKCLEYIEKYDPSRLVIHELRPSDQMRKKLCSSWVLDDRGDGLVYCHPKNIFERVIRPPERRRTCMLMVTHKCNLNCVYCYEKHKDDCEMSFETAKSAILAEAAYIEAHRDEFDEMEIDFMGGEPMMNMTLIKKIVEWLETEHPINIPFICFATTNGTLIGQHKKWLREHKQTFCLGVSYDGKSKQIANRGELAGAVPLDFCHELWPYQGFRATVSKESLRTLSDDVIWFHKNYPTYKLDVALAQGVAWTSADADIYHDELHAIGEFYLSTHLSEVTPINLLTRDLSVLISNEVDCPQRKFCGSGTGMMTYDTDGRKYGCHMFTPIVLAENALLHEASGLICHDMALEDVVCARCLLKHYCPTCLGFNFAFRGSIETRDKHQCAMFMAELRATCQFQMMYFVHRRTLATSEEAFRLKGAVEIWQKLDAVSDYHTFPFCC